MPNSFDASITRALSPMPGIMSAVLGASEDASAIARHTTLQSATSVETLIGMIPSDYQHVLRDALLGIAATTVKKLSATATLAKWEQHRAAGTYPSHLAVKAPEIQLTRDFGEKAEAAVHQAALHKAHKDYMDRQLENAIRAKTDDVAFLNAALQPDALYKELSPIVFKRGKELMDGCKLPVFSEDGDGRIILSGWSENESAKRLAKDVLTDVVVYAFRVICLVEARELAKLGKLSQKKAISRSADIEMADASRPGPSIQALVDKAVAGALKKAKTSKVTSTLSNRYRSELSVSAERQEGWEGSIVKLQSRQGANSTSAIYPSRWAQASERHQGRQTQELWEEGKGEGKRKEVAPFRYDIPSSYPNWLLDVPLPKAIDFVLLNTPINILEASQFRDHIHRGPNVDIPENIEHQLCVGMKFLFPSARNSNLIKEAWFDFVERLKWRLHFSFTQGEDDLYDPDYEIPHSRKGKAPRLPAYLDMGIQRGTLFVNSTIAKIPSEENRNINYTLIPSPRQVQEFLISKKYIVTNTDKNLGIAVSERTWIEEKCLELLSDRENYTPIHRIMMQQYCDKQCTDMEFIAAIADDFLPGNQIGKFLRSKITPKGSEHAVPVFYGIPKIHKLPVKMRPIVPCHSAIQNPAGKYVAKKLKPIVESAPTVLHSSKDLAIKLSKVKLDPSRQYFIVTGDVVAFYPNIPMQKCMDIATHVFEEFYWGGKATGEQQLRETEIFIRCLLVATKNLILRYQDTYYLQAKGLAMGVSHAPTLSQAFGAWFERLAGLPGHPLIPFYGRFIDDCLAIVYADSEASAINIASTTVQFDGCKIEWNASPSFQHFLDMTIYRDENGRLQHMPYRKLGSHMERIPWISAHPLTVRRGAFIGEMSRLAMLSSLYTHYFDAIKGLVAIYVKRGYPQDIVSAWVKSNVSERWEKRLNEVRQENSDVLVLKSVYNTAWDYFSAHELGEQVLGFWRQWIVEAEAGRYSINFPKFSGELQDLANADTDLCVPIACAGGTYMIPDIRKIGIFNRRMIVSHKRTRNLFDLTSLWKKTVLTHLEENALDDSENIILHRGSDSGSEDDNNDSHLFNTLGYKQLVH